MFIFNPCAGVMYAYALCYQEQHIASMLPGLADAAEVLVVQLESVATWC